MACEITRIKKTSGSLNESDEADLSPLDFVDLSFSLTSSIRSPSPFSSPLGSFTEAESSEDDDFMAGLAEQMAHSMLEDSEEESAKTADSIGMRPRGSINWMTFWHTSDKAEMEWAATTQMGPGGFMQGGLSAESQMGPWDGVPREDCAFQKGGMISAPTLHQAGVPKMHPSTAVPWYFAAAAQSPLLHNFPGPSFSAQSISSVPLSSPAAFRTKPSHLKHCQQLQKPRNADDDRESSCSGAAAVVWARHPRPHLQRTHLANPKASHPKAVPHHRPNRAASHCHLRHPNGGGSGMRAVFLGGSGSHKESAGTGVFLPLSAKCHQKKSVCSTVLLPCRVVELLNLQLDDLTQRPLRQNCSPPSALALLSKPTCEGTSSHLTSKNKSNKAFSGCEDWKSSLSTCSRLPQTSRLPNDWAY